MTAVAVDLLDVGNSRAVAAVTIVHTLRGHAQAAVRKRGKHGSIVATHSSARLYVRRCVDAS